MLVRFWLEWLERDYFCSFLSLLFLSFRVGPLLSRQFCLLSCSDSHARFTCTHYNTHALAHYTLTVYLQLLYFLFLSWHYRIRTHFYHHVFYSFFHSHSSHYSASWHTLSPSTLVTPDVGPPWPLRSRRLRSPRRSSRTQPHALLDHYLAPEQLARPRRRLHLATSNSLGHATSSPGHEQLAQPPLRDRSASATSPASSSIRQPSRSTSLDLEQLAQYPIQPSAANSLRHRNDTASSVVSFLQLRTPHPLAHRLSSQDLHRSPRARSLGQHALDKPAARVASTAGTDHLNTLSLEFAKSVTLWEFSDNSSWFLTLQSHVLNDRFSWIFACLFPFRMFCTFTCMHPHFTLILSCSFFQLVFFLFFWRGGYCSDSHARFTCTHYNTHALAHYTLTVYLQRLYFLFLSWHYRIRTHFYHHVFYSFFHSHSSHYSASWHTLSPSTELPT